MTGSYHIVNGGDATKPKLLRPSSEIALIPHIVNDIGAWGSGFVIAIDKAFGLVPATAYRAWHDEGDWVKAAAAFPDAYLLSADKKFALGKTQFVTLDLSPKVIIANMVAQHLIGMEQGPPIRYDALEACMKSVATHASVAPNLVEVHSPKFGSLRAGGDWPRIEKMIQDLWVSRGMIVVVYDFDEKP